jgi:hypothetical protein
MCSRMPKGFHLQAIPPVRGRRGRPRRRPHRVQGDRGDDSAPHRQELRALGITPVAWLPQWRRLRVRYERRPDIHEAFLTVGCALICGRYLR